MLCLSNSARGSINAMKRLLHNSAWFVWAAVLVLPLITAWASAARAASPFPDKNLEAAIRDVLKHEPKRRADR